MKQSQLQLKKIVNEHFINKHHQQFWVETTLHGPFLFQAFFASDGNPMDLFAKFSLTRVRKSYFLEICKQRSQNKTKLSSNKKGI